MEYVLNYNVYDGYSLHEFAGAEEAEGFLDACNDPGNSEDMASVVPWQVADFILGRMTPRDEHEDGGAFVRHYD